MNNSNERMEKMLWGASTLCRSLPNVSPEKYASHFVSEMEPVVASNNADMGMVGLLSDESKSVFVAFKGTDGVKDILTDIDIRLEDFMGMGQVHKGFLDAISEIADPMIELVQNRLAQKPDDATKTVYVTGHSKGGAMAALFGMKAKQVLSGCRVVVYTYGAPRVATEEFAKNYDVENHAYVAFADAVPHLPFSKEEERVLKRISPIYNTALYFVPMDFKFIGQRHDVIVEHIPYTNVPKHQQNESGEMLNSLAAVERCIRAMDFDAFDDIHNNDYDHV